MDFTYYIKQRHDGKWIPVAEEDFAAIIGDYSVMYAHMMLTAIKGHIHLDATLIIETMDDEYKIVLN